MKPNYNGSGESAGAYCPSLMPKSLDAIEYQEARARPIWPVYHDHLPRRGEPCPKCGQITGWGTTWVTTDDSGECWACQICGEPWWLEAGLLAGRARHGS